MPTLIDRFTSLVQKYLPMSQPSTVDESPAVFDSVRERIRLYQIENDRRSIVSDCRKMYETDPRIRAAIDTFSRDVIGAGFDIAVSDNKPAQAIVDDLLRRLHLDTLLDDVVRETERDGDGFYEIGVTKAGEIVELARKPTLHIQRNSDLQDKFPDPRRAYYWYSDSNLYMSNPNGALAEWQIIHIRLNHNTGNRYGSPRFSSARKSWNMLTDGEKNIAINRLVYAQRILLHRIPETMSVTQYTEDNRITLDNPFEAIQDFFIKGDGDVRQVSSGNGVGDIDDVLHHLRAVFAASPVPIEFITGVGDGASSLASEGLQWKLKQYRETTSASRSWLEHQFIRPLVDLQLLLQGVPPNLIDYNIEWRPSNRLDIETLDPLGKGMATLQATGLLTDEALLRLLGMSLPMLDIEAQILALKDRPVADEVARMARNGA